MVIVWDVSREEVVMALDAPTSVAGRTTVPARTTAMILLAGSLCSLFGLTWDVQWHSDVGPDTFFTLPHLFLYAGSAISGLASLTAVLSATAVERAGGVVDPLLGGRTVAVFGRVFAAPVGYLISGTGAASFLLYGLWDQWWHGLYGFDAVIDSPPHIGLLLSVMITLIGTTTVFAAAGGLRWGRVGMVVSLAVLASFSTVTVLGFLGLNGTVDAVDIALSWLMVVVLMLAAGYGRGGLDAVNTALAVAGIQLVTWWFAPWATRRYADFVGLPVRDYISGVPEMPAMTPMVLAVAALVMVGVLRIGGRWGPSLAGGLGALLIAGTKSTQNALVYGGPLPDLGVVLTTAVVAGLLGVLAGRIGWRFGRVLRLVRVEGDQA